MLLQHYLHYIISKTQCYCRIIYIPLLKNAILLQIHLRYIVSKTPCYCRIIYITSKKRCYCNIIYITLYLKRNVTSELFTLHYI